MKSPVGPRNALTLIVIAVALAPTAKSCECGPLRPACASLGADAIFLGKMSYARDTQSGVVTHGALVRFEVEERFKGIDRDATQVWVDSGSFTPCYATYKLGQRYLIFAMREELNTQYLANLKMAKQALPPGFDPLKSKVYAAPSCSGSRPADSFPGLDQDLAMLRAYRAGQSLPSIMGHAYLYPFEGWPVFSGPAMSGVRVNIRGPKASFDVTTDGKGNFSVNNAPDGLYRISAEHGPYLFEGEPAVQVSRRACGYVDFDLRTASSIRGQVLNRGGQPVPGVPVMASMSDVPAGGRTFNPLQDVTDQSGRFTIKRVPDVGVRIAAGSDFPSADVPYRPVYYPDSPSSRNAAIFRLMPGQSLGPLTIVLGEPLPTSRIRIRVVDEKGQPIEKARILAYFERGGRGNLGSHGETDARGLASIPCLEGENYAVNTSLLRSPPTRNILSTGVSFTCGTATGVLKIVLRPQFR